MVSNKEKSWFYLINIVFSLCFQYFLLLFNKKINYEHGYKKIMLLISTLFGFASIYLTVSLFYQILYLTLFIVLLNVSIIDLKYFEIPNSYNFFIFLIGLLFILKTGNYSLLLTSIISFILFLIISIVSKGALGGGDIKLAFGLGCFFSLSRYLNFLMYTFGVSGVIGIIILLVSKKKKEDKIPFGPFMAIGTLLALFVQ